MTAYIAPHTKVITPDGRLAVVVRYIDWEHDIRAICRYLDSPLEPAASLPPRLLKVAREA